MANEVIGITGVFVLTFCLIALYHFIGVFGRYRRTRGAHIKKIRKPDQDRRPDHDPRTVSVKDDSWLLWSPELDPRADPPKPGLGDRRETKGSRLGP